MFKQISPAAQATSEKQNLIELVMVHTSGTPAELERIRRVLSETSEEELQRMAQRIRLKVQTEATRQEYVRLQIVRSGLAHSDRNWQIIDQRLPGERLTLENFRRLVDSDQAFKQSLQWDAEPFADAIREEQQQSSRHRAQRRLFEICANAVTSQGVVNVAANDANFAMVSEALEEDGLDFTQDNVINLLVRGGLNLASNDKENTDELDQKSREQLLGSIESRIAQSEHKFLIRNFVRTSSTYAQLSDRIALCGEIADHHSPDQQVNNQEFCLLLLAKKDNDQYRQQVKTLRENKKFRAMTPLELKKHLAEQRAAQQPSHEERVAAEIVSPEEQALLKAIESDPRPALPETTTSGEVIDAAYLNRIRATDYSAYRERLQRHGRLRLEARIRGIK